MKIWIDGYEANVLDRLGSGQVAFELLKNLEKLDKKNQYVVLLPEAPLDDLPKDRENWSYKILKPRRLWTRIALPFFLLTSKEKPDIFFSPTHYIPRYPFVKKVVAIFDLSYLHFPKFFLKKDLFKLKLWTRYSIKNSDHIITISNYTKKDITENYDVIPSKISVAYPGYDDKFYYPVSNQNEIDKVKQKYNISGQYLIYIGTIQPRKNLLRLINAFAHIKDLKLVLVGKTKGLGREGWMFDDILKRPEEINIQDKIIFTGFVPNEELNYLINGAEAFILPSLYEGFGIPVVDAMACAVPVIVSNTSSLPEVAGEAGLFFDPYSETQIKQAIEKVVSNKSLRVQMSKASQIQAKKFSWKKMAETVLKVFEKVGQK